MHQVLQNPSLLAEIFSRMYKGYDGDNMRMLLVGVALTCKRFQSPALDVLWHSMTNIKPLVKLIPGVIPIESRLYKEHPITPADLNTLRSYARRIKYLILRSTKSTGELFKDIDGALLMQLLVICQGERADPLLPCLRTLDIVVHYNRKCFTRASPYLGILLSPMLQRLSIAIHNTEQTLPPVGSHKAPAIWFFLQTLASSPRPYLTEVTATCYLPAPSIIQLSKINSLKELHLKAHSEFLQDIQPLTNLQCLENMTLDLEEKCTHAVGSLYYIGMSAKGQPRATFSSLQALTLHGCIHAAHPVFRLFEFRSLTKVVFFVRSAQHGVQSTYGGLGDVRCCWPTLFGTMVDSAQKIKTLSLEGFPAENSVHPLEWSFFDFVSCLQLTKLELNGPSVCSISNEEFLFVASMFPFLEHLNINTQTIGTIDHLALITASERLPNLSCLIIAVHLYDASPEVFNQTAITPHKQLKDLHFYKISNEPEADLNADRLFNIALFPNLMTLDAIPRGYDYWNANQSRTTSFRQESEFCVDSLLFAASRFAPMARAKASFVPILSYPASYRRFRRLAHTHLHFYIPCIIQNAHFPNFISLALLSCTVNFALAHPIIELSLTPRATDNGTQDIPTRGSSDLTNDPATTIDNEVNILDPNAFDNLGDFPFLDFLLDELENAIDEALIKLDDVYNGTFTDGGPNPDSHISSTGNEPASPNLPPAPRSMGMEITESALGDGANNLNGPAELLSLLVRSHDPRSGGDLTGTTDRKGGTKPPKKLESWKDRVRRLNKKLGKVQLKKWVPKEKDVDHAICKIYRPPLQLLSLVKYISPPAYYLTQNIIIEPLMLPQVLYTLVPPVCHKDVHPIFPSEHVLFHVVFCRWVHIVHNNPFDPDLADLLAESEERKH
ncbi:hypothetical protein CVT24_002900 [Panaeolus cyanescens]|uniref:Uncharacterized protein n=1 Tax=Panaeolus cyanescens TaxID=181874 RepID=A0A409W8N4_9AGAR|nr:hypothetical protein CVT24_002900 [Panaeolus cyanescens]